jgi:prepilin-type N-terminal cleavage/methylation domain-containing protein
VSEIHVTSNREQHAQKAQRGFSVIELLVVIGLILVVSAMALIQMAPIMADSKMDSSMRQVIDQLRQGREYAIANRRFVKVTFPTASVGGVTQYEVVLTQMNTLTSGAGGTNPVLSTLMIQSPAQFVQLGGPDTPDAYGNSAAILFEGVSGGPIGGMLFGSDGELLDGNTYQPINGTVFLGVPGKNTSARAITVLGTTGRIRGWKGTGTSWTQF